LNILIIEDDAQLRRLLKSMLERDGHMTLTAENGNEGVMIAHDTKPDIVITDILMPEKEGLETIVEIRREYPDVKIIAMSGGGTYSDISFLDVAKRLGAQKTLSKPFTPDDLRKTIASLFQ
jgi:DNA-binding response OmpR family regulator